MEKERIVCVERECSERKERKNENTNDEVGARWMRQMCWVELKKFEILHVCSPSCTYCDGGNGLMSISLSNILQRFQIEFWIIFGSFVFRLPFIFSLLHATGRCVRCGAGGAGRTRNTENTSVGHKTVISTCLTQTHRALTGNETRE